MMAHSPLSLAQREAIYQGKLQGRTLVELAREIGCSYECARKWWRAGRRGGEAALPDAKRPREGLGLLSTFEPRVRDRAVYWKRQHPGRGATRILHDLVHDEGLHGLHLPQPSQLAAYFRAVCPELVHTRRARPAPPPLAQAVHEVWQIDAKENIVLQDHTIATVLDIREPVACVWLGNYAHLVQTAKAWRKLTLAEVQADLRLVFSIFGLPRAIQTDREHLYGQPANEAFPSPFTLWLVSLGIAHHFSRAHRPTDQPYVERGHRTWHDWLLTPQPYADLAALQAALDQARHVHAQDLPSRAGDCAGQPPLKVHPEVLRGGRPYHPAVELDLFQLDRVDQFLATFTWHYKVTGSGQVTIHDHVYYLGTAHAGVAVSVRFDPETRQFVFSHTQQGHELKRLPAQHLDVVTLTGLTQPGLPAPQPVQLSFPY
jgi:hypothetical protein